MRKDVLGESRRIKRKRIFVKVFLFFITIILFFAGLSSLFYISKFRIQKITIEGNLKTNAEQVSLIINSILDKKYLKILPYDNIFITPKEKIKEEVFNNLLRINSISIDREFPDSLLIKIGERKPVALFCGNYPEEEMEEIVAPNKCMFLDKNALVFEEAPIFSNNLYVRFFYDSLNNNEISLREKIIDEHMFDNLIKFIGLLDKNSIKTIKIIVQEEDIYQLFTNEGWYIILNKDNTSLGYLNNLIVSLDNQIKDKRSNLEYIDIRFGSKIFYKYK